MSIETKGESVYVNGAHMFIHIQPRIDRERFLLLLYRRNETVSVRIDSSTEDLMTDQAADTHVTQIIPAHANSSNPNGRPYINSCIRERKPLASADRLKLFFEVTLSVSHHRVT
jgi:hypothetical protein